MQNIELIRHNLSRFLKKYYWNELLKGFILFLSFWMLYLIFGGVLESLLWLKPFWRTVLFWSFVLFAAALGVKYLLRPLLRLLRLEKGMPLEDASRIIGRHFPEVGDKLVNLLQLSKSTEQSELLLAGIDQKSEQLKWIPFNKAVNVKDSLVQARFLLIPIGILLLLLILGKGQDLARAYNRVTDYRTAYAPPAPFTFVVLNDSLAVYQHDPFTLRVKTTGRIRPQSLEIYLDGERYLMNPGAEGSFTYRFGSIPESLDFYLEAEEVQSELYTIRALEIPILENFALQVQPPAYTGKSRQVLANTGNAMVAEGSVLNWTIRAAQTEKILFSTQDSIQRFDQQQEAFYHSQRAFQTFPYQIQLSNRNVFSRDPLSYTIEVIKDQYPVLEVQELQDSLEGKLIGFAGRMTDDYGLAALELQYRTSEDTTYQSKSLPVGKGSVAVFAVDFPGSLALDAGKQYEIRFRLTDNDGLRGGKSVYSASFRYYQKNAEEEKEEQLSRQQQHLQGLQEQLLEIPKNQKALEELQKTQTEKQELQYRDKQQLGSFLKRQQQQQQMMKRFSEELQKDLKQPAMENQREDINPLLQERLEREQSRISENEKLLKELEELSKKMDKDKFREKLEELGKQQNSQKRSLEQLLELTKRYFVQAKTTQLAENLENLARAQQQLADSSAEKSADQQALNKQFEKLKQQSDSLQKLNQGLKKPMDISIDHELQDKISTDQQKAAEELKQKEQNKPSDPNATNQKQRSAADKMRKMASELKQSMQSGGMQGMQEDSQMLRQILDNLLVFSFNQEELMSKLESTSESNPAVSYYLKKQNELRSLFEHIDDSLFALSLRRPELSEDINPNITEVYFNLDKTLERFSENQFFQGLSHQQYVMTATNTLADLLSDLLDNLQESLSGGSGGGSDFQLPDIIQSQEELNQQMQNGMQKGQPNKPEQGQEQGTQPTPGSGTGEAEQARLYEIYKQQQLLRMALEEQLKDLNSPALEERGSQLARQMEFIERQLLDKGMQPEVLRRMQQLHHQLLQLEQASFQQGRQNDRESTTGKEKPADASNIQSPEVQDYLKQLEILNRQVLPLRQFYQTKVQQYFNEHD